MEPQLVASYKPLDLNVAPCVLTFDKNREWYQFTLPGHSHRTARCGKRVGIKHALRWFQFQLICFHRLDKRIELAISPVHPSTPSLST